MRVREMLAVLAISFAAAANGREPDVEGFRAYATPYYTIVSHDAVTARRLPSLIAMTDGLLSKLLKGGPGARNVPTYILVVPQSLFVDYLQPCSLVCGKFVPGRFANHVLITDTRDTVLLRHVVVHQYAHLYLRSQFRGVVPVWFEEGVASLVELAEFRGSRALVGNPPVLRDGWMPLDRLLRIDHKSLESRCSLGSIASQSMKVGSWGLVHRAIIGDPAFSRQMFAFLDALDDLKSIDDAAQASFGMTVTELNSAMNYYTTTGNVKTAYLDFVVPPPASLDDGRKMSALETIDLFADAIFESGAKRERVLNLINATQRIAPNSAQVRVLRMRLAARDREDGVIDWLLDKLEPNLADPQVARGVGLALFERVRESRPDDPLTPEKKLVLQRRALELLDRSLRARHEDPEAAWAFGMLAASTKQLLGSALQRLLSASESVPNHADIAMATALVYESLQQPEETISYLADTARFSRSLEQRLWARQRRDEVRQAITERK